MLFATDFQGTSNVALPYALSIARRHGSKVYVAHVIALSPFSGPSPTSALRAIEAQAIREANDAVTHLQPLFGQIPGEFLIRRGDIWKEISEIVEKQEIDLIVVGTHGRQGASKVLKGSVAEKIFRHAPCPVLTIGPRIHGDSDRFAELHSILVPTDGSSESLGAISYAASLAQFYQGRLCLLHAIRGEQMPEVSLKDAEFTHDGLEAALRAAAEELGIKAGQMFEPVRVAVCGRKTAPPLFGTLEALGREICLKRIGQALKKI